MLGILAAVLLAAAPQQQDTLFTVDGGRLVGTVIEETATGVAIQLTDGTTRRLARAEVVRIEYADGSVSTPSRAAPPPPQPQPPPAPPPTYQPTYPPYNPYNPPPYAPPPPTYRPPPPPTYRPPPAPAAAPAKAPGMDPIVPIYASLGLGGLFMGGEVEDGVQVDHVFSPQLDVWLEGGVRLTPQVGLGLYVDIGVGDVASELRPLCETATTTCTATTGRVGLLLRHTFNPRAPSTPWLAIGTGAEFGSVSANEDHGGGSTELFNYTGWEMLRLMGGVDLRSNPVFGFGIYGGVSIGRYSQFDSPATGQVDLTGSPYHSMVEAGLRLTLFP